MRQRRPALGAVPSALRPGPMLRIWRWGDTKDLIRYAPSCIQLHQCTVNMMRLFRACHSGDQRQICRGAWWVVLCSAMLRHECH